MNKQTTPLFNIDKPVFFVSLVCILLLVTATGLLPEQSSSFFTRLQHNIVENGSWYYVLVVAIILVSIITLYFSRAGDIKLGLDHSKPEYSNLSWFVMLFSAGMGIGLMFYGVAEPVMHFMSPPKGHGASIEAAREAMKLTFFHWGLHAWAIYAMVALILSYFSHRQGLPLTLRSALYPIIGEKIHGPWGICIDVFAILGTTFGIATSLGLGVVQINSGLNYLFGIEINIATQIVLIIITMGLATISVVLGLDVGIKRLSELNMGLAFILLLCVLIIGPTIFILQSLMQNIGGYLSELVSKTFNLYAYEPTEWLGGWTILYWGWWLSWAPFVGIFIARISKGRTIREFIVGAMLVPCGFNLLWMSVFGSSAIELILNNSMPELGKTVQTNQAIALFSFFQSMPVPELLIGLSLTMVIIFFVTSADSGALVLNMLSSNGSDNTSIVQRITWTVLIALVTAVLLYAGGLSVLQTATIAGALPFSIVLLWAMFGFFKAVRDDVTKKEIESVTQPIPLNHTKEGWQKRLKQVMYYPEDKKVQIFIRETVKPAMQEFADELQQYGNDEIQINDQIREHNTISLIVKHNNDAIDFIYKVHSEETIAPKLDTLNREDQQEEEYYRAIVHLNEGGQDYCVMSWSKEQIISDIVTRYENHLHFIRITN